MNLDLMLAFHCAPTISGLKPANLIAHHKTVPINDDEKTITTLNSSGIYLEQLWECDHKKLTLVFNKALLSKCLSSPEIWGYLLTQGYPMYSNFETILSHLKKRISKEGNFPHEVGLFLGYPLIDVIGFIKNNGQNCKICGYWKVYGDEQEARCLFDSFTKVRNEMCEQIQNGYTFVELLSNN